MKRESFIVYKSFYGLIKLLKAPQRLAMYEAIFNYGFTGEMPEFSDDTSEAIWEAVLPQLKANQKRYENGLRGGAPVGNSNARKNNQETIDNAEEKQPKNNQDGETKNNQSISEKTTEIYSKKQPNENVNENENDCVSFCKDNLSCSEADGKEKETQHTLYSKTDRIKALVETYFGDEFKGMDLGPFVHLLRNFDEGLIEAVFKGIKKGGGKYGDAVQELLRHEHNGRG